MKKHVWRILYTGVRARARQKFAAMLERAGYAVSAEVTRENALAAGAPYDFVVHDGEAKREGRPKGFLVLTIVPAVKATKPLAPRSARASADPASMNLRELRESLGRTQRQLAHRTAMTQPQLSRLEARRDHLLSTLRRYVRALGGRLEISAVIEDTRVTLRDV